MKKLTFSFIIFLIASSAFAVDWQIVTNNSDLGTHEKYVDPNDAGSSLNSVIVSAINLLNGGSETEIRIVFPAHDFKFTNTTGSSTTIQNLHHGRLVLMGQGAEETKLIFKRRARGVYIFNAKGVTIRDIHLTRDEMTSTQGAIIERNKTEQYVVFQIPEGFPSPKYLETGMGGKETTLKSIDISDPLNPISAPNTPKVVLEERNGDYFTPIGDRKFKCYPKTAKFMDILTDADTHVAVKIKSGEKHIQVRGGENLIFKNLIMTKMSGVAINAQQASTTYFNDHFLIENVQLLRSEPINGQVPFFCGPGGGFQVYSGFGGHTITNNTIVSTADDAIAYFTKIGMDITKNTGSVISGNLIRDNQAKGILITQSNGGIVKKNTLIRSYMRIKNNDDAGDNDRVANWVIKNNTFINTLAGYCIEIPAHEVGKGVLHDNLKVHNNTFEIAQTGRAITINECNQITIRGNVLSGIKGMGTESSSLIHVYSAKKVIMDTNFKCIDVGTRKDISFSKAADETTSEIEPWKDGEGDDCTPEIIPDPDTIFVEGVALTPETVTIGVGEKKTISATVKPINATNANVVFESSDTAVVGVSQSGVITGVAVGVAVVAVTTKDGGKTDETTVTVKEADPVGYQFLFETNGDSEGWYPTLGTATVTNGVLTLAYDGGGNYNTRLSLSNASIDASQVSNLKIKLKNNSNGDTHLHIKTTLATYPLEIETSMQEYKTFNISADLIPGFEGFVSTVVLFPRDGSGGSNRNSGTGSLEIDEIIFDNSTNLHSMEFTDQIIIYPNPVGDYLNIEHSKVGVKRIEVYNCYGRKFNVVNDSNRINVATFTKGIYFVKASLSNNTISVNRFYKK